MSVLKVHHSTVYLYRERVGLGEHRMMFHSRECHDLRLIRTDLVIAPQPAHLRWVHDPFDNSVPHEPILKVNRFELASAVRPRQAARALTEDQKSCL